MKFHWRRVDRILRRVLRAILFVFFVNPLIVQVGGSQRTQREEHKEHDALKKYLKTCAGRGLPYQLQIFHWTPLILNPEF